MECKKCKKDIPDGSAFCQFCGAKQAKPPEAGERRYEYKRVTFYFDGRQYGVTGKTLKEAHAKAAKKKLELENAMAASGGDTLVKDWAMKWLDAYKGQKIGEGQYKNYRSHIKGVIDPAIGNKRIRDVRDIELQEILNGRGGKSKHDTKKLRILIKAIFRQARISGMIPRDPSESLELPEAAAGSYRSLTPEERRDILGFAGAHHAGLWVKTMLFCGLRPGETRALDWRHIDLDKKMLSVERAMKAGTTVIGPPKTRAGTRRVPIPDELCGDFLKARKGPGDPVFTKPLSGKRHDKKSMESMWKNFKRRLDISLGAEVYRNRIVESRLAGDLVPYCLRHEYCTNLQRMGVPLNIAKYLMGHSDIKTTANIYTDTTPDMLADISKKMNAKNKTAKKKVRLKGTIKWKK